MRACCNNQRVTVLWIMEAGEVATPTVRLKSGAHTRGLNGTSWARRDFRPTGILRNTPNAKRQTPNRELQFELPPSIPII
jgi:hypothetical protein